MTARIEHLETAGTFSLDGGTWEVENNVWIVGDDQEVVVIDPAHDAEAVAAAVGDRKVGAILLTHAHDDHVSEVFDVQKLVGGRIHLHPEDHVLWEQTHGSARPEVEISDGDVVTVAGTTLTALHTPGHSPGSTCFYADDLDGAPALFSGDTLFEGGPGATGKSYSSFDTIIESIRTRLFDELPDTTVVHTGHGPKTTIGQERPHLQEWIDRGE
ncbi:MAG: MBL fold metallo-hydrolase [Nesterenkonia sp.]|uniref:MBL fold metallo-hydrolase n=1 Tax=Nesterenkonia marinintestina TaxID=2979865 RepID=UPI0021C0A095|nr:MBL fold metallo-hydrolase [Nesterenkonia sp. GX14115]MDO5492257.1 MBL fold metallo-hydrolase [Nesterenkonia sp.]